MNFYMNRKETLATDLPSGLLLRRIVRSDIAIIQKWFEDLNLLRCAFGVIDSVPDGEMRTLAANYLRMIANPACPCFFLAICDVHSNIIGVGKYDFRKMKVGNVALAGLFMGEAANRGRGIGTKAMRLIYRYLFDKANVDIIELETASYNIRAQRSFRSLGMDLCSSLYSLEGIDCYGLGEYDAPKIFMRLYKDKFDPNVGGPLKKKAASEAEKNAGASGDRSAAVTSAPIFPGASASGDGTAKDGAGWV